MTFIDLIHNEISLDKPHIVLSGLLQPLYHHGYLEPGSYARDIDSILIDTDFFETIFAFLWLILVAEGYEQ